MQITKIILGIGIVISIYNCKSARKESLENSTQTDSTSYAYISSSAAVEKNLDSTRKFIRTADLKFKVKSVIKSTYDIENIVGQQGGFVTYTNLESNIDYTNITAVTADSSLETTFFTVSNSIKLRVPNTKLDTTLRVIARNIVYLDHRVIKADDVALEILSNDLAQKRFANNEVRLSKAIENRGKKLNETTSAEELLLSKQEQSDNAKISNLSLKDQINFSTVTVYLYQRQTSSKELISNEKTIEEYKPGFGQRIIKSVKFGWDMIEEIVIFLINFWAILLLGASVVFVYKRYKHRLRK
jgi:hypothetical protein